MVLKHHLLCLWAIVNRAMEEANKPIRSSVWTSPLPTHPLTLEMYHLYLISLYNYIAGVMVCLLQKKMKQDLTKILRPVGGNSL